MTFLPMVERELRVASRKGSTYWIRVGSALCMLLLALSILGVMALPGIGAAGPSIGTNLFTSLAWLGFAAAFSTGLFFTSDSLSEEKRDGTLGLLFLTDLRGRDVVSGKLVATSLRSFYALVACVPVMALPVLLGGVTGEQFFKTSLALLNALLFSLSAGLLASSIHRDAHRSLASTFVILLLLAGGGPALDVAWASWMGRSFTPMASFLSPAFTFSEAGAWGQSQFWFPLLINHVVTWILFLLAGVILPRTWQDIPSVNSRATAAAGAGRGNPRRERERSLLLDRNPAEWLAGRERGPVRWAWLIAILPAVALLVYQFSSDESFLRTIAAGMVGISSLALYVGVASVAARFLFEARRSGVLELILTTPLQAESLVKGLWHGFIRCYRVPLLIYLASTLLMTLAQHQAMKTMARKMQGSGVSMTSTTTTTNTINGVAVTGSVSISGPLGSEPELWVAVSLGLLSSVTVAANLAALLWFGLYSGLSSRNGALATLKTIAFVQVVPGVVIAILSMVILSVYIVPVMLSGAGGSFSGTSLSRLTVWVPLITAGASGLLSLGKDLGFIFWSRGRLTSELHHPSSISQMASVVAASPLPPPLPVRP